MKPRLSLVLAPLLILSLLAGCFGTAARDHVLAPAVVTAWAGVKEDVTRGPATVPDGLDAFDKAITAKDRVTLAPLVTSTWPALKATASSNIDAAPWSDGVKGLERDRLTQFDAALLKEAERAQ